MLCQGYMTSDSIMFSLKLGIVTGTVHHLMSSSLLPHLKTDATSTKINNNKKFANTENSNARHL